MTFTVRAGDDGKLASAKSQQTGPCPDGFCPIPCRAARRGPCGFRKGAPPRQRSDHRSTPQTTSRQTWFWGSMLHPRLCRLCRV